LALALLIPLLLPAEADSSLYTYKEQNGVDAVETGKFLYDYQWQNSKTDVSPWGWQNVSDNVYLFRLTKDGTPVSAYCADFNTGIASTAQYRQIDPEDASYFSDEVAARLRGIVTCGYRPDWTASDLSAAAKAAGASSLTRDEALTATQLAIWTAANTNAYAGGVSDGRHKLAFRSADGSPLPKNIEAFLNYLLRCPSISPQEEHLPDDLISDAYAERHDSGATIHFSLQNDVSPEDELAVSVAGDNFNLTLPLHELELEENGYILDIPNSEEGEIVLALSGWQTVENVCFYEAVTSAGGSRSASQNLIGWGETPVSVSAVTRLNIPPEESPPLAEVPSTGAPDFFLFAVGGAAIIMVLMLRLGRRR